MGAAGSQGNVDDSRHSLLSKARELSQTGLEAFLDQQWTRRDRPQDGARDPTSRAPGTGTDGSRTRERLLPRAEYGTYTVKEVEVATALTDCQLPGSGWSLNPYVGCSHDCTYCYVPDVAHVERDRWGSYVVVKRNLPRVLSRELKRKTKREVFLSSATDPYQPAEATHRITRCCLALLDREGWPVSLLTRNPIVCKDLDLLTGIEDLSIGMSVPTLDDDARRVIEPGAPPVHGRLAALERLADAGLEPYVNLAPAYPLTGGLKPDDVAQAFAAAGVQAVHAGRWRYLENVLPALRDRIDGTVYEELAAAVDDDGYYDRMFAGLRGAFRRAGIPFREMGPPGYAPVQGRYRPEEA